MSYRTLDSVDSVQVLGPQTVVDGLLTTFQSFPSGSILERFVPLASFTADGAPGLLASLSDAVEQIIQAGVAVGASGFQAIDVNGLLYDAVTFTVAYTPPDSSGGTLTAQVTIPVDVITADTSFGGFLEGGSATDRINETYQRLVAMATG